MLQTVAKDGFLNAKLEPGEYDLTAVYAAHSEALIPDAKEDVVSNVLKLKVTE